MKMLVGSPIFLFLLIGCISAETCIDCSSERDLNCARNATYAPTKECPETQFPLGCYVRIVDRHTIRGCLSDLNETIQSNCTDSSYPHCQRCFGVVGRPTCNDYVFPHNRRQCFQCSGDLNSPCALEMTFNSMACPMFQDQESCFIWRSSDRIERGCISSSGNFCTDLQHCFICDGHGCNMYHQSNTNIPLAPGTASIQSATLIMPVIVFALAKLALV